MKKAQGEIFGIALFFVILVVGILVFSQIKALDPHREEDSLQKQTYTILAKGGLESLLETSTGCEVERGGDSIQTLINFCLEYSTFSNKDPLVFCSDTDSGRGSCSYVVELLNRSSHVLFGNESLGPLPYELELYMESYNESPLHGVLLTNLGNVTFRDTTVSDENMRSLGFKKAPYATQWSTSKRNIDVRLSVYYR